MKNTLYLVLGTALVISAPAFATPGWDEPSNSVMPQAELSSGSIAAPAPAQQRQALAAAKLPTPNGRSNVIPNGPVTADPPGSGASSSATLAEHGEVGTTANSNSTLSTNLAAKAQ